jgi:protein-tyrosine phosphatase
MAESPDSALLFVCYGNICRSPIAEHLARRLLPKNTLVDSAGTHAWSSSPAAETVAVMRELYDIDIRGHRPKKLDQVSLQVYDRIFALSPAVADFIKTNYRQANDRLTLWEIEDPYEAGGEAFRRCARRIERHLLEYAKMS